MSDIAAWLENLGLGKYSDVFAENAIDFDILSQLGEPDLKELGIAALGDRKRLLNGIAALDAEGVPAANTVPDTPASVAPKPQAERRQLTVMFVDLVGSTALSGQLDPEDLSVIIRRYQNTVSGEINRLEGFVAKFMGDGVLAYFGWPRAHEDEAERAVRAGLAIIDEVGRLKTPDDEPLAARVGIATGQVVVGDIIGEGSAQEETVVGETPNIAARLEALAEPGEIVISNSTQQLCGEIFEFKSLGAQSLKGVAETVEVFRVGRERSLESRFQAQRPGEVLPLVGRETEFGQIMTRWRQAQRGEGQVILLSGEAGIGKSRIIRAVGDALEEEAHYRISYQCSPYHSDSALYPSIQQLTRAAGFEAGDDVETRLDKIETLLGIAFSEPRKHVPLIAALLSIEGDSRYGKLDLSPQQQRTQTLQALVMQLCSLAVQQPVLFVLEDAHWIDPTTLELIELALDWIAKRRVLLLISARPAAEHRFDGHPVVTRMALERLGRESSFAIVKKLSGSKALPAELLDEIVEKTDGVPLFVEELTKTMLETGETTVPVSLQDSLMARLDRLPAAREVAQTAACIGREFGHELLAAVAETGEQKLQVALAQLVEAELVFRHGAPPQAYYIFKHALVRDAAYESLLKSRRQQLHCRIAQSLEQQFPETAKTEPELLAHHYTQAKLTETAIGYWQQAGQRASERSAYQEAVNHLEIGLKQLQKLSEGEQRDRRELALQSTLGNVYLALGNPGESKVVAAFSRAHSLCRRLDDKHHLVSVLIGLWRGANFSGDFHRAQALSEEFLELSRQQNKKSLYVLGNTSLGGSNTWMGKLTKGIGYLREALVYYDPELMNAAEFRVGQDAGVTCHGHLARILWLQGYPDQALASAKKSLALADELSHPYSKTYALMTLAQIYQFRCQVQATSDNVDAALTLAAELRFNPWGLGVSASLRGWVLTVNGQQQKGLAQMLQDVTDRTGSVLAGYSLTLMADCYSGLDQIGKALDIVNQAITRIGQSEVRWWWAEVHRCKGELLLRQKPANVSEAETCFRQALAIAAEQEAKSLELRATTSLARLWRDRGKRLEARDLLAPVYDWFTEGFDTTDLKDAKALLAELT